MCVFLLAYFGTCLAIALTITAGVNWDRIAVWVMRQAAIYAYPVAIDIAISIERRPEQWNSDGYHLSHPVIGNIWTANDAYGLYVQTQFGRWTPNRLERRIIYNAVQWRLNSYIRDRVQLAMQKAVRHA